MSSEKPRPKVEVICQGSPREMGLTQGMALRARIREAQRELRRVDAFRLQQPWWLPYPAYRWLAEQHAAKFLRHALLQNEALRERLGGIANGAGLGRNALYLLNALEPLLSSLRGCTVCPGACSAVAVRGQRSATEEPILAHNFDYFPIVQPYYVVRESRPRDGLRAYEFTMAPLAGAIDGMNEAGLCITYDYAFTTDIPSEGAPPISVAISSALEKCSTVAEAADWIASQRRWGGGLLMLADASGDIGSLELSSTRCYLRRPEPGQDAIFHSNALFSPQMREVQIPWEATFSDIAPAPLRGRRLHESSELRDRRFTELLREPVALTADTLAALMADHGPDGIPGDFTPCVHGAYWYTTACLQFLPRSKRMRIAYGTACQAAYEEFAF